MGIGIDIIKVSRLKSWLDKPDYCKRFFHPQELDQVFKRGQQAAQSLAVRFAAREAFSKALGTGLIGIRPKEVWVWSIPDQPPLLMVEGETKMKMDRMGADKIHLSLAHDRGFAIAQVILEAKNG